MDQFVDPCQGIDITMFCFIPFLLGFSSSWVQCTDLRTLLYDPDFIAITKPGATPAFTHEPVSNQILPHFESQPIPLRFRRDITEPTSQSRSVEFLLEEARRHVEPEVLSQLDLTKDEDRKRLQALVDEKQAQGAKYVYQVEVQVIWVHSSKNDMKY